MYTEPTGYSSSHESAIATACRSILDTGNINSLKLLHKTMQWANIVVTVYDAWDTYSKLQSGESTIMDLALVIMGGVLVNSLLQCWVGSETAAIILKAFNAKASSNSLMEAIKSKDPEKIYIKTLRFMVALYSFHCECFTGETLVSTTEGDKRIDEIEVGDYVYAYDTETQENVPAKVTYVSVTETNILVHVYTSEGEEIKATMLHPFYVKNAKSGDEEYGMWKASANLVAGDELLTEDGRVVYVEEIRLERLEESIKVYNLEVEGLHTYYVGSGILVHNEYQSVDSGSGSENTLGDDALVVRGGISDSKNLSDNQNKDPRGHISANAADGLDLKTLATTPEPFKNGQISITTVGEIRGIGMDVIPDPTKKNPYHVSIVPKNVPILSEEADALSNLFKRQENQWKPEKKGK